MRPLTLSAIFAAIISLSSIIGSVVVVDERYAHAADVRALRYEFQATTLEGKLDRLQDRRFKLEDRLRQNPRDDYTAEILRQTMAEQQKTEQQLKIIQQKLLQER